MNKIKRYYSHLLSIIKNVKMYYMVEASNWTTTWDGIRITEALNQQKLIKASIGLSTHLLRNKIIHYGSRPTLPFLGNEILFPHQSNKSILTWFHINPDYTPNPDKNKLLMVKKNIERFEYIHTSCTITKQQLLDNGFPEEKIVIVPLGINTKYFKPYSTESRTSIRRSLGIPDNVYCIGSFQKDGAGWDLGMEPKMVKGPDIFCSTVKKISEKYPVHCLLVGPSRGYVKSELKKAGIPFTHRYSDKNKNMPEIELPNYYNALDLYIISSRVEGGPLALLESVACGIPLLTTNVGMAKDIIENGKNGYIANGAKDIDEELTHLFENKIINIDRSVYEKNAVKLATRFDYKYIVKEYYNRIYSKLI